MARDDKELWCDLWLQWGEVMQLYVRPTIQVDHLISSYLRSKPEIFSLASIVFVPERMYVFAIFRFILFSYYRIMRLVRMLLLLNGHDQNPIKNAYELDCAHKMRMNKCATWYENKTIDIVLVLCSWRSPIFPFMTSSFPSVFFDLFIHFFSPSDTMPWYHTWRLRCSQSINRVCLVYCNW